MNFKLNHKVLSNIVSSIAGILVVVTILVISQNVMSRAKQIENVDVIYRFIGFQHDIEAIVYNNITLVNGYLAYVKSDDTVTQDKTTAYLDELMSEQGDFIRNIGIIEDTTIIWNYPLEGNESSIGVDLAAIEGQKDVVLNTKKTMQSIFQGPVNLVQGGVGFIARLPLERNGTYWGQVSIVIDGEAFYNAVKESASKHALEIALYNIESFPDESFFETMLFDNEQALEFYLDADIMKFKVKVKPKHGWTDYWFTNIIVLLLSISLGLITSFLVSRSFKDHEIVKHQANHDSLTGLFNRNYLEQYQAHIFEQAAKEDLTITIMIMDINRFKSINDIYGHQTGDSVLKWVAQILKDATSEVESVFRLGGDEFLIAFPDVENENDPKMIYEKILKLLKNYFYVKNQMLEVTLSVGFASYPFDGENIDDLIKIADKGMYEMKEHMK